MDYRKEAIECVKDHVLPLHKQIYAKYDGDFDRIYTEWYNSKSYQSRVIEPGKVYELSYLECSCPKVKCGLRNNPDQCECSRQSILYILSQLEPDSRFDVQIENTILRGGDRCTFRITRHIGMKREISPQESSRAEAFRLWMSSPMPMVTLVKTLDVTRLEKACKKTGMKFTSLMCWCIGKAASQIEEFYTLPENGKLFQYDRLAINVIVNNKDGGINSCDILFTDDPQQFNRDYLELTTKAAKECKSSFLEDCIVVGTSAMIQTELNCIVNQYTDMFSNPMVMWGKYRKGLFKTTLPVSFQFHHVQMDGGHAARFLDYFQKEINQI